MSQQLGPLPSNLPFRVISETIGRGAYASIKKAIPLDADSPVFAVKFIHKPYATSRGRISAKQMAMEVSLHSHIGQHPHIIEWFASGEDEVWRWIAVEYASGGDLFDKIEADTGVPEDVAQIYFNQLIAGVSFMHSKGVAHRDLKPENILLSATGSLKIADFGMATMFAYQGQRKSSSTVCGSPPYVAPEVLACARTGRKDAPIAKYDPEQVDIWSCGVILFVLLVGNTPWDAPTAASWEFNEYRRSGGHSSDELWQQVPTDALSLLRGILSIDPAKRFGMQRIRQHPWFTRPNELMAENGRMRDPLQVATIMLERLRIDFTKPLPRHGYGPPRDSGVCADLDLDPSAVIGGVSSTQPEPVINDPFFDLTTSSTLGGPRAAESPVGAPEPRFAATQPSRLDSGSAVTRRGAALGGLSFLDAGDILDSEPGLSQFSQAPGVPVSLTQRARQFRDLVPEQRFTRFYSVAPPQHVVELIASALHNLGVQIPNRLPAPDLKMAGVGSHVWQLRIRALDGRKQGMHGQVVIDRILMSNDYGGGNSRAGGEDDVSGELLDVTFFKTKGDPLEWRRFFKRVVLLCEDAVFKPEA